MNQPWMYRISARDAYRYHFTPTPEPIYTYRDYKPLMTDRSSSSKLHPETKHTSLVISPLNALMKDQMAYLQEHNISCGVEVYMRFTDLRKVMFTDAEGGGEHHFSKQEQPEFAFMQTPGITSKDAPFGTNETPNITMKIVGGRHVPVIEKHPNHMNDMGSRVQPLQPLADKPNHLDPRTYGDSPAGGYYNDVQKQRAARTGGDSDSQYDQHGDEDEPTGLVSKRPDSKDLARCQYGPLPPIQANRHRMDLSTVFELEAWTGNRNQPLDRDTEYKRNFDPEGEENGFTMYEPNKRKGISVSDKERDTLYMLVPRHVLLPVEEIKLTKDQETTLCKLLCNDLEGFDSAYLRDIYIDASQKDPHLNGFCAFEHLDHVLRKRKAYIGTDTMRLLASQYVNPSMPGKVNYEKILSYIGSALEMEKRGQLSADRPKYYQQNDTDYKTGSIYKDREVAKLLRTVEQELSKNTYSIDWNRWRNAFHMRDREHRETLSAEHIKDICYDQQLPLSDSLLNQILALCTDNNKDGQYRWMQFLDFLGKVQCCNTGLPIPVSKRPLEYAKHYPAPVPNWPRAEGGRHGNRYEQIKDSPRHEEQKRRPSPRRDSPRQDDQQKYDDRDRSSKIEVASPREPRSPFQNGDSMERLAMQSPRREENQGFKSQNEDELRNVMERYSPVWRRASPARERSIQPGNRENSVRQRERSPDIQYTDYRHSPRNRNRISRGGWQKHVHKDDREPTPNIDYREPKRFTDVNSPRIDRNSPGGYDPSWQDQSPKKHNHPPPPRRQDEDNIHKNRGYTPSWQERQPRNRNSSPPHRQYEERDERYRDDIRSKLPPKRPHLRESCPEYRVYTPPPYYSKREHTPLRRHQSMSPTRQRPPTRFVLYDLYEKNFYDLRHYRDAERNYESERGQGGPQTYRNDEGMSSQRMTREERIKTLTNQLNSLQANYKMNKDSMSSREQPWVDRYLKMADALYSCDVTNKGSLPMKDVMEIVRQYNLAFNLQLDEFKCNQVATDPANRDKSGNVVLQPFLARLSA